MKKEILNEEASIQALYFWQLALHVVVEASLYFPHS